MLRGTGGAVACGHPLGASAAIEMLREGGSAVDAAIAAVAVLAVVLPDACGLGGDAMLLVRPPSGEAVALNGSGVAPRRLRGPIPADGPGTVAVPGAVAACGAAHAAWGRVELARVLAPARRLACNGFAVGEPLLAAVAAQRPRLTATATSWPLLNCDLRPGAVVRQPALGRTLERLGVDGASALYEGELASAIARAIGNRLDEDDLAWHRTDERGPLRGTYGDATLLVQPPVSQGLLALLVLKGLEGQERSGVERTHAAIELVEAAFARRDAIAVPGAEDVLLAKPLEIDPERAGRRGGPRGYSHTTAITAADGEGMVVAVLASIFDEFGSAVLVPEAGFLLNDRLLGFSVDPASPNAPAPGRRPVHTLAPLVVEEADRVIALATPGADGQVQFVVQVLDGLLQNHEQVTHALARPRWRSVETQVAVEDGFDAKLAAGLTARGHALVARPAGDAIFGAMCIAGADRASGSLFAVADGRRETWAAAW
jgi:gamma-glutamyltranspeptidase/glutathione hydrolase